VAGAPLWTRIDALLAGLSPAYFALVMATGIVSVGAHLLNVPVLDVVLLWINVVAYAVHRPARRQAPAAVALRPRRPPPRHGVPDRGCRYGRARGAGRVIAHSVAIGTILLAVAAVLWLILTYAIFSTFMITRRKPSLAEGINGGWLLAVVATQSITVLLALLSPHWQQPLRMHANFLALSMWLWGGMLYIWIVSLIFYRYTFFEFSPSDLAPPYWINMGAMAISVLAGSLLISNTPDAPFLRSLRPFLEGFTVFYWATGTWWIPIIAILGVWRYVYRRLPFTYDPLYWGAVFPLGMYAVATYRMSQAMSLGFLHLVPRVVFWVAFAAWLLTFAGLLRSLRRDLGAEPGQPDPADAGAG
jgi:tellurite resistance protein TehA-like permease